MDQVTALTIDKGQKNTRLLIQPQYNPMPVEYQIAILFCGTTGLLKNVPISKVHAFEKSLLNMLEQKHRTDILDKLKAGVIDDDCKLKLKEIAKDIASSY